MLININDVLEETLSLDIEEKGADLIRMALGTQSAKKAKFLGFSFLTPVSVHLDLSRLDENLVIVGSLKTTLGLQCGSCTKDFSYELSTDFTYASPIKPKESRRQREKELDLEDVLEAQSSHIEGTDLNVTALVLEQISLAVPIKPLCTKDCKGLCAKCGTDLNTKKCECASSPKIDSRLAGLKNFRAGK